MKTIYPFTVIVSVLASSQISGDFSKNKLDLIVIFGYEYNHDEKQYISEIDFFKKLPQFFDQHATNIAAVFFQRKPYLALNFSSDHQAYRAAIKNARKDSTNAASEPWGSNGPEAFEFARANLLFNQFNSTKAVVFIQSRLIDVNKADKIEKLRSTGVLIYVICTAAAHNDIKYECEDTEDYAECVFAVFDPIKNLRAADSIFGMINKHIRDKQNNQSSKVQCGNSTYKHVHIDKPNAGGIACWRGKCENTTTENAAKQNGGIPSYALNLVSVVCYVASFSIFYVFMATYGYCH